MSDKQVSATTTIDAPPDVVFAIVANPHEHPRIDGSGSVRSLIEGPDHVTKGDTFAVNMKLFGAPYKITNTVVEYEPDRRIAWRHFGGHRWRYELEPSGTGTRVTETFDYSRYNALWTGVITVLGFPGRNRKGIEGTLVRLKDAAECDARASRAGPALP
ncbi:SRPBCC family protein [Nocardioides iriomotensis]|uniref:Dimethyladenosine transferase n=1 Tax=Nocardioides iriomotensis TaxID=715784 RepID=A0A4Q5IZ07_9ACTN|nr:SRPBCC family protein [Nocardioides iriomotensis]RYU10518.1 dimethyladenosine transferase [Nocardioides iriomotensis]